MSAKKNIACFITPHGFGHAARSSAILEALQNLMPEVAFHIFTLIPPNFFKQAKISFEYHKVKCDIGLVQKDALREDPIATVEELDEFLPFSDSLILELTSAMEKIKAKIVLCDIAPLGIAVAKRAGIPSILIQNFTWDWIYEKYLMQAPTLQKHIDFLRKIFKEANFIIQTEPVCYDEVGASLKVNPVSRPVRRQREEVRCQLLQGMEKKIVLVSMGGAHQTMPFVEKLKKYKQDYLFILPAADCKEVLQEENILFLPHHSDFYHPDLVNASDAVIGKIGYSTVAEIFATGTPFGYVPRSFFRESPVLVDFIQKQQMPAVEISHSDFLEGNWLGKLAFLCSMRKKNSAMPVARPDGATEAARFIQKILGKAAKD